MKNVTFVPRTPVRENELRAFVVENGGLWHEQNGLQRGAFQESTGFVYVDLYPNFLAEFDEQDKAKIEVSLGCSPDVAISLHVGHSSQSEELLSKLVKQMQERWDGVLLDLGNAFSTTFGSVKVLSLK